MNTFEQHHKKFCQAILDGLAKNQSPKWFNITHGLCANFTGYVIHVMNTEMVDQGLLERSDYYNKMHYAFKDMLLENYGNDSTPFNADCDDYYRETMKYQNFKRLEHLRKFGGPT